MREDFDELRAAVKELAEAQARTEARVEELAEAQARTEARVGELAEAQARTEARVGELAEAQARTEARVGELAEAQARTEARVGGLENAVADLAQAQRNTEKEIRNLAQQVGSLSDTIGFSLEDIAKIVLPGYLERHLGVYVIQEELERKYFVINGKELEINLYGEARKDGKKITIIGESKSKIYQREVEKFVDDLSILLPTIKGEVLKVMFGFVIHPSAMEVAKEHEITLVASYQR